MKKAIRFTLTALLIMLTVVGFASVRLVSDIGHYGTLINYVGIVRGASQRVVKLEISGTPSDQLISYVDEILDELRTGEGPYGLEHTRCAECNENIELLSSQWETVKREIGEVRTGKDTQKLLSESETLFAVANETVFSFQDYSTEQTKFLGTMIIVMTIACIIGGVALAYSCVKHYWALKKSNETLADKVYRDELTGAYLLDKFTADAEAIIERNPAEKFAILYIDFENFKYINDVFGYQYGDEILKKFAAIMLDDLDENERFARNVADRFVALHHYHSREDLVARQKKAEQRLTEEANGLQNKFMLNVVYGICCLEDVKEKLQINALINRANFAQKTIKNHSDTHYGFYNEHIRERMIEEVTLQSRMHTAMENREFVVYLQPKVDPDNGAIRSAEALVRWETPDKGLIPPNAFIPVFEKNHFISELDRYVFETVCQWLAQRMDAGQQLLPISVNVSRLQFYKADFVKTYSEIRDKYGIPRGLLEIEFTETVAFENQDYMVQIAKDLHQSGFLCSLDDFGTGYSSLGILKDLPIDVLKLDASFFGKSQNAKRDDLILKGIIALIKELGILTVAEGIERKEQVDFLRTMGCDLIQGYYFYRPMPIADLEKLLEPAVAAVHERSL